MSIIDARIRSTLRLMIYTTGLHAMLPPIKPSQPVCDGKTTRRLSPKSMQIMQIVSLVLQIHHHLLGIMKLEAPPKQVLLMMILFSFSHRNS
jgi:hypothetical protein